MDSRKSLASECDLELLPACDGLNKSGTLSRASARTTCSKCACPCPPAPDNNKNQRVRLGLAVTPLWTAWLGATKLTQMLRSSPLRKRTPLESKHQHLRAFCSSPSRAYFGDNLILGVRHGLICTMAISTRTAIRVDDSLLPRLCFAR